MSPVQAHWPRLPPPWGEQRQILFVRAVAEQFVAQTSSVVVLQLSPVLVPGSHVGVASPPSGAPASGCGHCVVAQSSSPLVGQAQTTCSPRALHGPSHVSPGMQAAIASQTRPPAPPRPPMPPRPPAPPLVPALPFPVPALPPSVPALSPPVPAVALPAPPRPPLPAVPPAAPPRPPAFAVPSPPRPPFPAVAPAVPPAPPRPALPPAALAVLPLPADPPEPVLAPPLPAV